VQFIKEGKTAPVFLDILERETTRLTNILNDFLIFSRPKDAPRELIDLGEVLRTIAEREVRGKQMLLDMDRDISILANRVYLDAAIGNIVRNAVEAADTTVKITLHRIKKDGSGTGKILLEVEDDGPGIPDAITERIFEPFVTTKKAGTGLGLALANRIVTSLGGRIAAGRSGLGGARLTVELPGQVEGNIGKGTDE
jgi:signal transduction histidine kinase